MKQDASRKKLQIFQRLLRELQKIDPEFPLQYAICLCEIALEEGISPTSLSERTGMPLSTVSRIVGALSSQRQKGAPYGLVRVAVPPTEKRRRELYLSARGKAAAAGICDTLG